MAKSNELETIRAWFHSQRWLHFILIQKNPRNKAEQLRLFNSITKSKQDTDEATGGIIEVATRHQTDSKPFIVFRDKVSKILYDPHGGRFLEWIEDAPIENARAAAKELQLIVENTGMEAPPSGQPKIVRTFSQTQVRRFEAIKKRSAEGENMIDICREFTSDDEDKAQSMLRNYRHWRKQQKSGHKADN